MVKVVTDSVADLPESVSRELDITVVPLTVRFGNEEFRDRIDISLEEFYRRLRADGEFPTTSMPPPAAYAEAYDRVAEEADELLVVTISGKLSAAYDSASDACELMTRSARVEVVDSFSATMAEGFVAMKAAEAAKAGATLEEVRAAAERARSRVDFLCTFDTLEYLRRGGRIGAASAFLGSILKINPLIAIRDGVIIPAGRTRSRSHAVDRLVEFVAGYATIEELSVESTDCLDEADALTERLEAYVPKPIHRSSMTPVIGAHTGPGLLLVSVLGERR